MKLLIKKVDNGYILENLDKDEAEFELSVVEDAEGADYKEVDARTIKEVLQQVMNYFGYYSNKHDSVRCVVRLINQKGKEM